MSLSEYGTTSVVPGSGLRAAVIGYYIVREGWKVERWSDGLFRATGPEGWLGRWHPSLEAALGDAIRGET